MTPDSPTTVETVRVTLGAARLAIGGSPLGTSMIASRVGENDLRGWWQGHAIDRTGQ